MIGQGGLLKKEIDPKNCVSLLIRLRGTATDSISKYVPVAVAEKQA